MAESLCAVSRHSASGSDPRDDARPDVNPARITANQTERGAGRLRPDQTGPGRQPGAKILRADDVVLDQQQPEHLGRLDWGHGITERECIAWSRVAASMSA